MPFRIFDAEGKVGIDDRDVDRGLTRIRNKVRETVERVDSMEGTAQLKADASQLDKEIDRARQKLRSVDRQRVTATADMDPTQFDVAEAKLRAKIKRLEAEKVEIDVRMGRDLKLMDRTLTGVIQRLRGVGKATPWQDVQKLGNALHNARITLGPLSLSLRGLIVALLTLAPLVTSVAGTIGGLAASLGTALAGAAGLGAAGLAAFGLQALGIGLILKPMIHDLGAVFTAQKAYNTAVEQYGSKSKQAQTALEKVHSVLKSTSPALRGSWKDLRALSTEWTRLTSSARPEFFKTVADGIQTARDLMPTFARQSRDAFEVANRGVRDWLAGLRTAEAQNILGNIMRNANDALRPLMDGLGQLGVFFGRVFDSFSRHFKPLADDFRDWARGIANAAGDSKGLNNVVDELVASFRSWVGLLHAVGRLIGNFFMAGSESGRGMLDDITELVNKWADFLGTKEGQRAVQKFLDDAWDTTKKLVRDIGDLARLIQNLADAGKPVVDWLLDAVHDVTDLINKIDDATGAGDELVTALAGLIILRKAVGWAIALSEILGGGLLLKGLKGLGKGVLRSLLFPTGAVAAIGATVGRMWRSGFLRAATLDIGGAIAGVIIGSKISDLLGGDTFSDMLAGAGRTFASLGHTAAAAFGQIKESALRSWDDIKSRFSTSINLVIGIKDFAQRQAATLWRRVRSKISDAIDFVFNLPNPIGLARGIWRRVQGIISDSINFIFHLPNPIGAARSIWNRVKSVITDAIKFIFNLPNPLGAARSIWNRVKGIISDVINFNFNLPDVIGAAQAIWDTVAGIMSQGINLSINVAANLSGIPGKLLGKLGLAGGAIVSGFASGGRPLDDPGQPITAAQAVRAMQNGPVSPMGGKLIQPRMINNFQVAGEQNGNPEFVIPTNPNYRGRARRLLAEAVSVIGTGFARGVAAGRKKKKHTPRRPRKVYSGSHYLAPVRQLEDDIAIKDNALTQLDRKYGTDARFHPMVDDDGQRIEANIKWHVNQLDELAGRAEHLATLEKNLADAIRTAHERLRNAMDTWAKRRPPATIVRGSGKKKERVDNPKFKTWADKMNDLRAAYGEVPLSDAQAAGFRSDDYSSDAYDYRADIKEARATTSTPLSTGGMDAFLRQTGMFDTLQGLNLSVAQAAATLDNPLDDRAAASSLAGFWESVINKIGPQGDKELLTEAYSNLASARQGAADNSGAPDIGTQTSTFNQARSDMFREFSSNFSPGGSIVGAIAGGVSRGVISGLAGGRGGVASGGAEAPTPTGKQVTFHQENHYAAPPPDPHTFVKSMAWEAQAL